LELDDLATASCAKAASIVTSNNSRHNSSKFSGTSPNDFKNGGVGEIPHVPVTAALERERGDLVASVRFRNRRVGLTVHSVRRLVSKLLPLQSHSTRKDLCSESRMTRAS
jgi:hypothetical protein